MDLTEIEQNLKKEILDESGYASDEKLSELAANSPVDLLSEINEVEPDIKIDHTSIGQKILEQKWQNRLKIFDEIT